MGSCSGPRNRKTLEGKTNKMRGLSRVWVLFFNFFVLFLFGDMEGFGFGEGFGREMGLRNEIRKESIAFITLFYTKTGGVRN